MRNAENKEIDLLLRDLARRESAKSAVSANARTEDGAEPGEHLDADELSSFAEGVLPAATRSFYAAHLADCSRCRRIVAQLGLSSGAAVRQAVVEPSKSKLWSYIANFFTPGVMRYAVPALSLVILAAIAFVWLRQARQSEYVAQVGQSASEPAPAQYGANQGVPSEEQKNQDSAARSGALKTATTNSQETSRDAERSQAKNETVATDSIEREQKRAEPTTDVGDAAAPPSAARAPDANTAFSPKPAKEVAEESKREGLAKARQAPAAPTAAIAESEDERRNRQDKDDAAANKKAETRTTSETVGGAAGRRPMITGGTESNTRTVAGRHFRRINNAWVDTAYDSGAQTTTLARGSEQYRALIGDEPGLRTIAEQLNGEVIVVWKGRAYRIR